MNNIKYRFRVDRLEVSYTAPEEVLESLSELAEGCYGEEYKNNVKLVRADSRNYKNEFEVYTISETGWQAYGLLQFGSPNPHRQYVYLSVLNERLYDGGLHLLMYIESVLHFEFLRVSKLDIALDVNINLIRCFYRLWRNPEYVFVLLGHRTIEEMTDHVGEMVHISTGTRKNISKNRSFSLSNSENSLSLAGYNKSDEIAATKKKYIADATEFKKIYRLEVRMSSYKEVRKTLSQVTMNDVDLYCRLTDEKTLLKLFIVTLSRLIRVKQGRKSYTLLECLI